MTDLTFNQVYAIGAPIILFLILLEAMYGTYSNKSLYKRSDTLCTMGLLFGNILVAFGIKGLTLLLHIFLYQFRIIDLAYFIPLWFMWVLTFIMIDLVFYFYHRMSHRVRFLWAIHMTHHSSEQMNFSVSFRQAWLGPISKIPFFMVLPLLGFDPMIIAVAGVISTLWGIVGHTKTIYKLGPLEYIFNTPSHHRVHHGANEQYIDKNYGNLLIIWDRVFGTFEPEKAKVKFGLVKNVNTFNPITITIMEWKKIFTDLSQSKRFKDSIEIIFGPPNTHNT